MKPDATDIVSRTPALAGAGAVASGYQPMTFSTTRVRPDERLARWEEYNERELFGLRCSTLSGHGLLATQTNLDLERLRFTEIVGNDHVIERTPSNIARKPVDSIMVALLLEGDAFFYHSDGCETLTAGDAVVYDTERPFMYGFSSAMRQVLLEVPRTLFEGRILAERAFRPQVLRLTDSVAASTYSRAAANTVLRTLAAPPEDVTGLEESVLDLLGAIMGRASNGSTTGYLLAAKDFVRSRLREPDLSIARVAHAVGLSERHLARVFADDGTTVARFVSDARLAKARELLASEPTVSVAEVSVAVGFVSAAHFARAFKARFGLTPSEARSVL